MGEAWAGREVGAMMLSPSIINDSVTSCFSEGFESLHDSIYYANSLYRKLCTILYILDTCSITFSILCTIYYYTNVLYTILYTLLILYTV